MNGPKKVCPLNPLGQNAGGGLFEQKSHGTGLHCAFYIRVIIVRRENEYSGGGDGFENLTCGFQTIEHRQRDVHDDYCGAKFFDHGDRLAAVFRFTDHFEVVFQLQYLAKTLTHDRVVFSQQNSDSFHRLSVWDSTDPISNPSVRRKFAASLLSSRQSFTRPTCNRAQTSA
jgi:hypothetical protein